MLTPSSEKRIKRFVDGFIRSGYVAVWSSEKDVDFINEPDRARRVAEAAMDGADGRTHSEVIEDWREAFESWIYERRKYTSEPERFITAVEDHFDSIEAWHDSHGSLFKEIG